MQTSGLFKIHQHTINVEKLNETHYLLPFGDVHLKTPLCDTERWESFRAWANQKQRALFLGVGDYIDLASSSNRLALKRAGLYDFTRGAIDEKAAEYTADFISDIKFMEGRLLGLMGGNHFYDFPDGTSSDSRICQALGTTFLGASTFVRLSFDYFGSRATVDIWAHHGKGAARSHGGSLKRVEDMADQAEADIYLMGHDHKKSFATKVRLALTSGGRSGEIKLRQRKIIVGRTGGFLKGYVDGVSSYVVDGQYGPLDLGVLKIELTPRMKSWTNPDGQREKKFIIDLHCSG